MRPYGKGIIDACEALDEIGPSGYAALSDFLEAPRTSTSKYLRRAVEYGLVVVKKPDGRGTNGSFGIFSVVPDWRKRVFIPPKVAKAQAASAQRPRKAGMFSYVSSIFAVGQ